jgi:hypothetical protein
MKLYEHYGYILYNRNTRYKSSDCRGRGRMVVGQLHMQSVPITTVVVSSNLDQGEVYNIM